MRSRGVVGRVRRYRLSRTVHSTCADSGYVGTQFGVIVRQFISVSGSRHGCNSEPLTGHVLYWAGIITEGPESVFFFLRRLTILLSSVCFIFNIVSQR